MYSNFITVPYNTKRRDKVHSEPFIQSAACIEAVSMYADRSFNSADNYLKNYHYENDIHYTLQMCQWLLKFIGLWPLLYHRTSRLEQLVSFFLLTTCFSSLLFIIVPSGHYFVVEKRIELKVKLFGPVGFCLTSFLKYCYLIVKGTSFERCIQHIEQDWKVVQNSSHRTIMFKYATFSRNLTVLCAVFLYSGGMSYHTVMQFLSKERSKSNYTFKPLAYPVYDTLFDTQTSPTYEIVFFVHCLAGMIMYSVTTAAYSLAAIFVTHICAQIQIQIARLEDLVQRKEEKNNDGDPLIIIVRDHVKVLRFAKNVEELLRNICLIQIFESTLILCLLEHYCLTEWENSDAIAMLTFFTLLMSFTFNIFIFCYIGEVLSEQCSQIGAAVYEIKWYNLSAKRAYDLILLNVISQYPPKLTAGKIIELSYNTFSTVVKTSVVYLNILRTATTW
ncbi:Odorant receptor 4 [Anthophora retusa]